MVKKKTGWPLHEGYVANGLHEIHVFTDYKWNNGKVWRDWKVDPETVDLKRVAIRPFSLHSAKDHN